MATWTTIPDSSLEPGKPIRSIDGLALRDNPVAIAEGQPSAPRIVGKAAKRLNDMPVLTVSASDAFSADIGSNREYVNTVTSSTSFVVALRYTIFTYTGSMRFRANFSLGGAGGAVVAAQFVKNNVVVQSYSGAPIIAQIDSTVAPGDVFEWRHRTNSGFDTSSLFNDSVTASDAYTTRPLYIAQSEVNNP
jgi:hypothetical protein